MYDYIIVGQGIAGTLVAHFLIQQNKKVLIVDKKHEQAASMVAAGLINPITGRNFVKSWQIDRLIPFAVKTYKQLEQDLNISILETKNVAMLLNSVKAENDWLVRSSNPDLQDYVAGSVDLAFYQHFLDGIQNGVEFKQAGRVKLKALVLAYKKVFQQQQGYLEEAFDYKQLIIEKEHLSYKQHQAKKIIFAEGYQAIENPYFNYLPFGPAKGDILIVRIPNYPAKEKLVKHGVFIIHLEEDLYWIGSTYNRDYKTIKPVEKAGNNLKDRLKKVLKIPFEVIEHLTAIRPTVRDRRPFIGQHPEFKQLYLFNGMGAKGSYLSPLFAHHFVSYLEKNTPLQSEVDIKRYQKYLEQKKA